MIKIYKENYLATRLPSLGSLHSAFLYHQHNCQTAGRNLLGQIHFSYSEFSSQSVGCLLKQELNLNPGEATKGYINKTILHIVFEFTCMALTNQRIEYHHLVRPAIFLNYIIQFMCILILTDECSYHPSSKGILFTVNRDHPRKPQLDTLQRSTDHGEPSPRGYNRGGGKIESVRIIAGNLLGNSITWTWLYNQELTNDNITQCRRGQGVLHGVPPLCKESQAIDDC